MPQISEIQCLSKSDDRVSNSHHYTYALPHDDASEQKRLDLVVMGICPSQSREDMERYPGCRHEETFNSNFRDSTNPPPSSENWRKRIEELRRGKSVVCTEAYFWSGRPPNLTDERIADLVKLCFEMNKKLIEVTNPKAVVVTGMSDKRQSKEIADGYNLTDIASELRCSVCDAIFVRLRRDQTGRGWFFIPHLSNSRGQTNKQRTLVADYIHQEAFGENRS